MKKALPFLAVFAALVLRADERLVFDTPVTACFNRWVALEKSTAEGANYFGFVYLDISAGPTFQLEGALGRDANGKYAVASAPGMPDKSKSVIKVRIEELWAVAPLPETLTASLGLPAKPDWMKFYERDIPPETLRRKQAYWMNHLGDSEHAIALLEPEYAVAPEAKDVQFELAFAYNATGAFDKAIKVLAAALRAEPDNLLMGKEYAYALVALDRYPEAIAEYQRLIPLCKAEDAELKSEFAFNLAAAYGKTGDARKRKKWLEKARDWAPPGSNVARYFAQAGSEK